jgi:glutamine synthetase
LIAGILDQLSSLIALACPANVSYQRLVPSTWSAPYRIWGVENREAALRLIPTAADGGAAHLEIKAVDPSANPYLLLGALQAQILEALKRPRPLPPPQSGDPAGAGADGQTLQRLPSDLNAARTAFARDAVMVDAMGPLLHSSLLDSMASEIQRAEGVPVVQQIERDRWWPLVGDLPGKPG